MVQKVFFSVFAEESNFYFKKSIRDNLTKFGLTQTDNYGQEAIALTYLLLKPCVSRLLHSHPYLFPCVSRLLLLFWWVPSETLTFLVWRLTNQLLPSCKDFPRKEIHPWGIQQNTGTTNQIDINALFPLELINGTNTGDNDVQITKRLFCFGKEFWKESNHCLIERQNANGFDYDYFSCRNCGADCGAGQGKSEVSYTFAEMFSKQTCHLTFVCHIHFTEMCRIWTKLRLECFYCCSPIFLKNISNENLREQNLKTGQGLLLHRKYSKKGTSVW